ncbi:MAG: sugar ABC transporter permease [Anaerolineae bacterium]|nr:sugar ABC transporter permease [Anaerolineae bacterium]MDW8100562.1 sugar ABC transporter permease [Anaerolineae bacterium]
MGISASVKALGLREALETRFSRQKVQQRIFILTILIPLVISFALFWVYPVVRGFWGSFTQWRAFDPNAPFVGMQQYVKALNDPIFRISLRNTFYYTVLTIPANVILALLLALAIEASGRARTAFRTIYFLPVVTSTIATALVWKWLYQPSLGLFNQLLTLAGLPTQRWLLSPQLALPSIAIYSIWKNVGFTMVIFMAGLTTIPQSFYDAAKVDGANRWQTFWHITIPLLQPTFVFVLVTGVIGALQVFGPIYVMSAAAGDALPGGPNNSTMVVAVYQWLMAFRELELGYGSAMGLILFLIILALTLLQLRILQTRWEY